MNVITRTRFKLNTTIFGMLLAATLSIAYAAPGAHGPDGEHLDAKSGAAASASQPRMEAHSDMFELVATLYEGELSILVDRYKTNEPLLNAELEVESGGIKAKAKFHADHGDYAIDDPALLKLLQTPGEHALVFTIIAGQDTDLLDGTLVKIASTADGHGHDDHDHAAEIAAWAGLAVLGIGVFVFLIRRRNSGLKARKGA